MFYLSFLPDKAVSSFNVLQNYLCRHRMSDFRIRAVFERSEILKILFDTADSFGCQ